MPHSRQWIRQCLLALALIIVAATYLADLGHTPVYFGGDEAYFAVIGSSLSRSGTNLTGDRLPIFVRLDDPADSGGSQPWGTTWYQPLLFYLVALVLKVLPLTEATVRLPTAVIGGIINPLLMYAVGVRLFRSKGLAVLGATILMLSPPHLILSRQALDYVAPIPFVLSWLWCLLVFVDTGRPILALAAGMTLGLGCYSYITSWAMMPGFLLLSWLVLWHHGRHWVRAVMLSAAGFVMAVLPAAIWLWLNPQLIFDTARRYQMEMTEDSGMQLLSRPGSGFGIGGRLAEAVSIYWDYFDPAYLFMHGGPSMTASTGRVGVFLLPMAIGLPVGFYALTQLRGRNIWPLVVLAGFFAAPIPAVLRGVSSMVQRELLILPFAAIICVYGVVWLRGANRHWRPIVALGIALLSLQYAVFVRDYWGHYKLRSAFYYDPVAFAAVADAILSADRSHAVPAVYLSRDLHYAAPKWRFYLTKANREELLGRTHYIDAATVEVADAPAGSLWVIYEKDEQLRRLADGGRWSPLTTIADVDHRTAAVILRRVGDRP